MPTKAQRVERQIGEMRLMLARAYTEMLGTAESLTLGRDQVLLLIKLLRATGRRSARGSPRKVKRDAEIVGAFLTYALHAERKRGWKSRAHETIAEKFDLDTDSVRKILASTLASARLEIEPGSAPDVTALVRELGLEAMPGPHVQSGGNSRNSRP